MPVGLQNLITLAAVVAAAVYVARRIGRLLGARRGGGCGSCSSCAPSDQGLVTLDQLSGKKK